MVWSLQYSNQVAACEPHGNGASIGFARRTLPPLLQDVDTVQFQQQHTARLSAPLSNLQQSYSSVCEQCRGSVKSQP